MNLTFKLRQRKESSFSKAQANNPQEHNEQGFKVCLNLNAGDVRGVKQQIYILDSKLKQGECEVLCLVPLCEYMLMRVRYFGQKDQGVFVDEDRQICKYFVKMKAEISSENHDILKNEQIIQHCLMSQHRASKMKQHNLSSLPIFYFITLPFASNQFSQRLEKQMFNFACSQNFYIIESGSNNVKLTSILNSLSPLQAIEISRYLIIQYMDSNRNTQIITQFMKSQIDKCQIYHSRDGDKWYLMKFTNIFQMFRMKDIMQIYQISSKYIEQSKVDSLKMRWQKLKKEKVRKQFNFKQINRNLSEKSISYAEKLFNNSEGDILKELDFRWNNQESFNMLNQEQFQLLKKNLRPYFQTTKMDNKLFEKAENIQKMFCIGKQMGIVHQNNQSNQLVILKAYLQDLQQKQSNSQYMIEKKSQALKFDEHLQEYLVQQRDCDRWSNILGRKRNYDRFKKINASNEEKHIRQQQQMRSFIQNSQQIQYDLSCLSCCPFFYYNHNILLSHSIAYPPRLIGSIGELDSLQNKLKDGMRILMNGNGGVLLFDCHKHYEQILPRGFTILQGGQQAIVLKIKSVFNELLKEYSSDENQIQIAFLPLARNPFRLRRKQQNLKYILNCYVTRINIIKQYGNLEDEQQYFMKSSLSAFHYQCKQFYAKNSREQNKFNEQMLHTLSNKQVLNLQQLKYMSLLRLSENILYLEQHQICKQIKNLTGLEQFKHVKMFKDKDFCPRNASILYHRNPIEIKATSNLTVTKIVPFIRIKQPLNNSQFRNALEAYKKQSQNDQITLWKYSQQYFCCANTLQRLVLFYYLLVKFYKAKKFGFKLPTDHNRLTKKDVDQKFNLVDFNQDSISNLQYKKQELYRKLKSE